MDKLNYKETYSETLNKIKKEEHDHDKVMQILVGGEFEAFGILEREILKEFGLRPNSYLIDVGCGSGRLSKDLAEYMTNGKYLGIDILEEAVEYARNITKRNDWRFEVAKGLEIPEEDDQADMVCFFSVFTHLLHEESYLYLKEAKRVLKNNGKIIFSFLEFKIPSHWTVFEGNLRNSNLHLNMFIEREAIKVWANRLGLNVVSMIDGDKPHIRSPDRLKRDNGSYIEKDEYATLGQSICVLSK